MTPQLVIMGGLENLKVPDDWEDMLEDSDASDWLYYSWYTLFRSSCMTYNNYFRTMILQLWTDFLSSAYKFIFFCGFMSNQPGLSKIVTCSRFFCFLWDRRDVIIIWLAIYV